MFEHGSAPLPVIATAPVVLILGRRRAPIGWQLALALLVFFTVLDYQMGSVIYTPAAGPTTGRSNASHLRDSTR